MANVKLNIPKVHNSYDRNLSKDFYENVLVNFYNNDNVLNNELKVARLVPRNLLFDSDNENEIYEYNFSPPKCVNGGWYIDYQPKSLIYSQSSVPSIGYNCGRMDKRFDRRKANNEILDKSFSQSFGSKSKSCSNAIFGKPLINTDGKDEVEIDHQLAEQQHSSTPIQSQKRLLSKSSNAGDENSSVIFVNDSFESMSQSYVKDTQQSANNDEDYTSLDEIESGLQGYSLETPKKKKREKIIYVEDSFEDHDDSYVEASDNEPFSPLPTTTNDTLTSIYNKYN